MFYQRVKAGILNVKENAWIVLGLAGLYLLFRAFFWTPESLGGFVALAVGFTLGSVMYHFGMGGLFPKPPKLDTWADSDAVLENEDSVAVKEIEKEIQAKELEKTSQNQQWRM